MENNELVAKKAKEGFWNGIVVPFEKVEEYVAEDDCVVIGPGMPRQEGLEKGERKTGEIVNFLLKKYASKKWVVDGGALQEMETGLLNEKMIVTPHAGEFKRLFGEEANFENAKQMSEKYGCVILLKGVTDVICKSGKCDKVEGGNEGMTKGGTGDVLAGLAGALYCRNEAFLAAKTASLINKIAGDELYKKFGPFYNSSDLVAEVGVIMKGIWGY
jgi:NAD(P)H-hydrate epimerase